MMLMPMMISTKGEAPLIHVTLKFDDIYLILYYIHLYSSYFSLYSFIFNVTLNDSKPCSLGGQHAADCNGLLMHCDGDAHMRPRQLWGSTMP